MTTALSIIEQALRKGHVLGKGEALDNDTAQQTLVSLNNLLGSWSISGGLVYTETRESFPLTGATSYTIGSGGDFNTAKPYSVTAVFARVNGIDYSLAPNDQVQYASISYKGVEGVPTGYYFDNNFPLATLFFFPVPNSSYEIHIYSQKPLTKFTSLTDDVALPEGYEMALVFNLWVAVSADFEKEPTQNIARLARTTKKDVFKNNTKNENNVASVDEALIRYKDNYNIYEGY